MRTKTESCRLGNNKVYYEKTIKKKQYWNGWNFSEIFSYFAQITLYIYDIDIYVDISNIAPIFYGT